MENSHQMCQSSNTFDLTSASEIIDISSDDDAEIIDISLVDDSDPYSGDSDQEEDDLIEFDEPWLTLPKERRKTVTKGASLYIDNVECDLSSGMNSDLSTTLANETSDEMQSIFATSNSNSCLQYDEESVEQLDQDGTNANKIPSRIIHTEKNHSCRICGESFFSERFLKMHLFMHEKETSEQPLLLTYPSDDCVKEFGRSVFLHPRVNFKMKNRSCPVKKRKHEADNTIPLICATCGKAYLKKGFLEKHMLIHSNEMPSHCKFEGCEKQFKRVGELKSHIDEHNKGVKPHKCPYSVCQETFTYSQQLYNHICTHIEKSDMPAEIQSFINSNNITLRACKICEKKFYSKKHLDNHQVTHSGLKPFNCTVEGCDQKFSHAESLKSHQQLIHGGKKDHKCPLSSCGKIFAQKRGLDRHISTHLNKKNCPEEIRAHFESLGVKYYICADCERIYTRRSNIQKHVLRHIYLRSL